MKIKVAVFSCLMTLTFAWPSKSYADAACDGNWVNPISDICWKCLFPLSIGSTRVSSSGVPDTQNPSSPIQYCPMPPPIFYRVGVAIGFWEPFAVTDVTRAPGCMVNMGGFTISGLTKKGTGKATKTANENTNTFYHVHWYKYPLISWLNMMTAECMQGGEYDIGYLSEIDPTWQDDELALFVSPESVLFANPIAQLACGADAISAETGLSQDALFWCAGAHGSVYPFTGNTSNEATGLNTSTLLSERMNFKLHRQGMILDTVPENKAVCYEYPSPIIPKNRYRYQVVNTIADSSQCHPYGRSTLRWQAGKELPNSKKNYGQLIWKKRNCVVW
ncbi:conjugal transfer protein TraU [Testudinibacter sp. TR-2022]|uniref:conjugal transfer pilus assembly protein TraU n=1 Tax=Testudinibacter sp. TR-2022 TaxID=2585029 RepID=UPI001117B3B7|nr:conjugal transfer pilus assembly protein TraU [Testudinibacter sp. TR-2022]TNH04046.1 conjugal transfer protein TraU [Pasteurellaceae bacterium Phil31]TNH10169.1 conjugal transfer protein TraU [Testudinibacter sp. TR-2022]TNH13029.1 conjugal transfer protein TraU [Testudinibacter sp. TR-2022]